MPDKQKPEEHANEWLCNLDSEGSMTESEASVADAVAQR